MNENEEGLLKACHVPGAIQSISHILYLVKSQVLICSPVYCREN